MRIQHFLTGVTSYSSHGLMRTAFAKCRDINRILCAMAFWVEEVESRVSDLEELEKRVAALEAKPASKPAVKKKTAAKKK